MTLQTVCTLLQQVQRRCGNDAELVLDEKWQ